MRRLVALAAAAASLLFVPDALAGWCGAAAAAPARDLPDLVTGAQIHALVALPADAPDTFASDANRLADDAASLTAWWQGQDATRVPRFDTASFGGSVCLDISLVRLPDPGRSYSGASAAHGRVAQQLRALGFGRTGKDYLVYVDGVSVEANVCGTGGQSAGRSASFAVMWLQGCSGVGYDAVSAHELLHALGALPEGAPHACPADAGHPCDAPYVDALGPYTDGRPLAQQVLDVGRDDYYAHSGSWIDIQDSIFLRRLDTAPVSLSVSVSGSGSVTSDLSGVDCAATCTTQWDAGSQIFLAAEPAPGQRFVRWVGACRDVACALTLTEAASVGAVFGPARIPLRVTTAGNGAVACTPRCGKTLPGGEVLTLRAVPAKGWRFVGWSGACKGTGATCRPKTDFAVTAKATFRKR